MLIALKMYPLCIKRVLLPFKIEFSLIQFQKCKFLHQTILNFDIYFNLFFTVKSKTFHFRLNRLIGEKGTKKIAPPSSWSTTRVNQEKGGAQNFIKAKNGKGQTQFKAYLV